LLGSYAGQANKPTTPPSTPISTKILCGYYDSFKIIPIELKKCYFIRRINLTIR